MSSRRRELLEERRQRESQQTDVRGEVTVEEVEEKRKNVKYNILNTFFLLVVIVAVMLAKKDEF